MPLQLKLENQTIIATLVCFSAMGIILSLWYAGLINTWIKTIDYIMHGAIIASYGTIVIVESLFQSGKGGFPKDLKNLRPTELIGLALGVTGIIVSALVILRIVIPIQMMGAIAILIGAIAVWLIVAAFN